MFFHELSIFFKLVKTKITGLAISLIYFLRGKNDIFVVPNHLWRRHVNLDSVENAILYGVTDAPLLQKIGHFRSQGRTQKGDLIELN